MFAWKSKQLSYTFQVLRRLAIDIVASFPNARGVLEYLLTYVDLAT